MPDLPWLFIFRFVVCLAAGCVATRIDLRERRIPNWLTIPLLVSGILFRGGTEWSVGLLDSAAGVGVGFGIFFVLWLLGGSAAGDVKFMAAVGAWLGPYHTFMVIVLSAIWLLICMAGLLFWRVVAALFAPQQAGLGVTATGSHNSSPANLLTQVVPYALPATLAIGLRLAWMLLLGRTA